MLFLIMDIWELANDLLGIAAAAKVNNEFAKSGEPVKFVDFGEAALTADQVARLKEMGAYKIINEGKVTAEYLNRAEAM
jgi:hypothetical protein